MALSYEKLLVILKERNISVEKLAEMSGVRESLIMDILAYKLVDASAIYKIANALNCNINDVVGEDDDEPGYDPKEIARLEKIERLLKEKGVAYFMDQERR